MIRMYMSTSIINKYIKRYNLILLVCTSYILYCLIFLPCIRPNPTLQYTLSSAFVPYKNMKTLSILFNILRSVFVLKICQ